jgi:hypothetical protein
VCEWRRRGHRDDRDDPVVSTYPDTEVAPRPGEDLYRQAVGRRLLRMNEPLLLGEVAGARCNSGGMQAAQETTRSNVPALSYPVTFAISNIALTLLSYVMAMVA